MPKLATQLLTPIAHRFVQEWTTSAINHPGDPPIADLKTMMRQDPVAGLCAQLTNLYILSAIGEYVHPKKRIEKEVRAAIAGAKGSWKTTLAAMLSFIPYGRSYSEVAHTINNKKAILKEIRTLDPQHYYFEGSRGEITNLVYRGVKDIKIPYDRGIHLVNEPHLCFGDPLGIAAAVRAYPYWKLHQVLMPILSIASQRQATPILVYKTEVGAAIELVDQYGQPLLNAYGEPVTTLKGTEAIKALESLSSSGAMAIDLDESLESIPQSVAGDFLMSVVKLAEQYRMMAFLVPSTIASFSSSGVGDAGLAESQKEVFEAISASRAEQLADSIIENVIKPMIVFNHGAKDDYGSFPVNTKDPNALEIAKVIAEAFMRGAFTPEDFAAADRLKQLLGVEEEEEPKRRKPRSSEPKPEEPQAEEPENAQ